MAKLKGMMEMVEFKCHWDDNRVCENEHFCSGCQYHPSDDDKPNGKKPPIKIGWECEYDGSVFPQCPACGEMPYSTERCTFCGQRFIQDDSQLQEYTKPTPEERMDCFICGGKNTMVGRRAKCNGHFHGHCEQCGCTVIE